MFYANIVSVLKKDVEQGYLDSANPENYVV